MARTQLIKRLVYAVPMLGAMAFGTAQAFASPAAASDAAGAWCNPVQCANSCGGPGQGGCDGFGVCICF
jgi:hypothetical protein